MSKELQISQGDWSQQQIELLKNTLCKGISDGEFQIFLHACKRTGLDPFMRQIYAVKRRTNENGVWKEAMTLQTGVDGYRLIADRTGSYAPGREPTFIYDKNGELLSATAYVKKLTKDGTWHEVSATAFYAEYVQKNKDGNPTRFWKDMKHSQLAKCAECLALRRGFPAELSGIYSAEEMQQADNVTIQAQVEEIPTLSQEEIAEFCANFNGDKEMTAAYIQMCMEKKKWTVSEAIMNMQKDLKKSHEAYKKWLEKVEKNKPQVEPMSVIEAPSMEPQSIFEEVK